MSLFISFEGPEGSGKTTQCGQLVDHMTSLGFSVVQTREPGGTAIGRRIRSLLLDKSDTDIRPLAEFLLFSASRAQLVREVIRPQLDRGGIVVCDRFFDSSLAYQGYGHGLDLAKLRQITSLATGGLSPDLTFLLDIDPEVGLCRRVENGMQSNRMDSYDLMFHERARKGFLELASGGGRWVTLDARENPETVGDKIRRWTMQLIGNEQIGVRIPDHDSGEA